jgi:hypothetical protein
MDQASQSLQALWLYAVDYRDARRRCCCGRGKGLQLQIAERERTAVIETIDELMGMESDRHPMFSEGYDYALDHIKRFVQGRRT